MLNLRRIEDWIDRNREDIINTISELVRINTVNIPPIGNEKPGQEYLYHKILDFIPKEDIDIFEVSDIENIKNCDLYEPIIDGVNRKYKNRPNIVAKIKGAGSGRSIVFSGHMDTVDVMEQEWQVFKDPFSGNIKDGKMYGRGVLDMKAGTVSGFFALKCIKDLSINLSGTVYAESVVDEELGGVNGTIASRLRYPDIDFAILSEPTDITLGIETRCGSVWKANFNEKGPGGYLQKTNPINKLSEFVLLLEEYDIYRNKNIVFPENYNGEKLHKLLLFLMYSGGKNYLENASYIPKEGYLYFYIPNRPYTKESELWNDFNIYMENKIKTSKYLREGLPEIKRVLRYFNGNLTDKKHPAMNSIKRAYNNLYIDYEERAFPAFCDAEAFKIVSGTEVVLIGPKGKNLHGMDEYVEVDSIFDLIKIMVLTAADYCK
jgi:acetylornithine deacetylase